MGKKITIGTRGSKLALWQSNHVKDLIKKAFPEITVELKIIQTKGDKILDVSLSKIGDKNLFTKEIELALLNNSADIAVHSLKDLPTILPEGLQIGAVLERAEIRDVLISKNGLKLSELTKNHTIGTSSLRRQACLWNYNPKLNIIDIRGNVDTRIQKMHNGHCDAIIMAAAGIIRLGLKNHITEIIPTDIIKPATSQGIIAVECRENDPEIEEILQKINHQQTWILAQAERSFLNQMNGGCQLPLGCVSTIKNNILQLDGLISSVDGKDVMEFSATGYTENPSEIGKILAAKFIEAGAERILKNIKNA